MYVLAHHAFTQYCSDCIDTGNKRTAISRHRILGLFIMSLS